ncbi:glycoside hydrolase family protein [Escherichia coli]|nr:glycoside hydrolase family protein [Escherichia coli]
MNPSIVKRCLVGVVLAIAATLPGFQQLHTSVEGLKLIADYEGCRLQPYQCSAGVWTDGIGNTSGVIPGKTITERQAAEGLISNVLRVERSLERCVKQQPPQKVYDAVVSFAFNVGTGNACSSTLVKLLNQRRWADACRQLPRWVYVKGVFNQGLDNRGFEADQLDLELDDADGKIVLPRRGAVITLALGWKGQPLFPKGAFTVDEIEHTGAPDRLTIRARSADFRETLNTRREKSWHKTTVGEVVKEIAARHKLKMALGKDLSDKPVEHIDQTNESDGSFLMRLARQYGAIASVKNGNLLFIRQGQGKSATGKPLPVITITRKDGDSHRFTLADRGAYTGVIASWLHTREPAKKESTTVKRKRRTKKQKKEPEAKQGDYLVGTDENVLVLNRTYANRSNAERAAKMQWERLQRGVASFSLQLAEGRADLYTEMPVKVSGFKQPIDDAEWTITTLTHTVSPDNGFTTSIELEVKIDDLEME